MVLLRCQISHTPATIAGGLGNEVEVKYGGVNAPNLYLCTVLIQNDSSRDLASVVINMTYKDGTIFLSGGGAVIGSNQSLPLTSEFVETNNQFLSLPEAKRPNSPEQAYINAHRDFVLPVFNRGSRAQFAFTVHGLTSVEPILSISSDHLGAKLVLQPPLKLFWGESNDRAAVVGLLTGIFVLVALPYLVSPGWGVSWTMFFVGATGTVVGAVLLKFWRALTKMLS